MARFDSVGFFWEDQATTRGEKRQRVMPPIPETGWRSPTEYPNLSNASVLSIDCETYDPELDTNGPGWARGKGHIVGVSIGADGGGRWYFPMRHEVEPEYNLNPETTLRWLSDALGKANQPKVGANLTYDVGWLKQEGVEVAGDLVDIQYAEALLDERSKVGLDILGWKYLGEVKATRAKVTPPVINRLSVIKGCGDFPIASVTFFRGSIMPYDSFFELHNFTPSSR